MLYLVNGYPGTKGTKANVKKPSKIKGLQTL